MVADEKDQKPVGFEGRLQFGRNRFVEGAGKNYDDFALTLKEKGEHLPFNGRMEGAHDGCINLDISFEDYVLSSLVDVPPLSHNLICDHPICLLR